MNSDYIVERIDNGFIVTGNDSTKNRRYFSSLTELVQLHITEEIKELEKMYREHEYRDETLHFKFSLDEIVPD